MALEITRISRPTLETKGQNQLAIPLVEIWNPGFPKKVLCFSNEVKCILKKEPAIEPSTIVQKFFA